MTSEIALKSARAVARNKKCQDTEPYKCIDAFTRVMPTWDKLAHVLNDLAKNILMITSNTHQMAFNTTRQNFEHNLGRFILYNGTNAPWRTSAKRGLSMEEVFINLKVFLTIFTILLSTS